MIFEQMHQRRPRRLVEPLVLKQGNVFLLCTADGDILPDTDQGLYFHDMRYLSQARLAVDGAPLLRILADASDGHRSLHQLARSDHTLGVRREKILDRTLCERITLENFACNPVDCTVELTYDADFLDMFVVRGVHQQRRGKLHAPRWRSDSLVFRYDGADGHQRTTALHFDRRPDERRGTRLTYRVQVKPRSTWSLTVTCELSDGRPEHGVDSVPDASVGPDHAQRQRARGGQLDQQAQVQTSNALFNAMLGRSFVDLHMLRMREGGSVFFAAGVPWYVALFGRDTLVTSLQVLAFEPSIAANTLRVLARHQGTRVDDQRDEQPGKILHELRVDEMANLGEVPQTPYYGSVDSTPLFLVLLAMHAAWTGSLEIFHQLQDNVHAALEWIDRFGDSDGDGFIDYRARSADGGRNQGWKDSANGIVMQDGGLAEPPIALPEVQGEVYLAWRSLADLFERDGQTDIAERLRARARSLKEKFNREFWLPNERYFALCRQANGQFSSSIASNAAHALWTGIVDARYLRDVVRRVLRDDMFSGWGVRTLSSQDRSYNPLEYQLGSIWPHDNAMIVAGMHQAGFSEAANQVFGAMVGAAAEFEHFRLPELFAGYDRSLACRPVRYPVACNPQAWAAGAIPHMLSSVLGLQPCGFDRRLTIVRPSLPGWLEWVEVTRLRVGESEVDLRFESDGETTAVTVTRNPDQVAVRVVQ